MAATRARSIWSQTFSEYGMLLVLLLLCVFFGWATYGQQRLTADAAARQLADRIAADFDDGVLVLIVARTNADDVLFANRLESLLRDRSISVSGVVSGAPFEVRRGLEQIDTDGAAPQLIACNQTVARWALLDHLSQKFPALADAQVVAPASQSWPTFFKRDNLRNVANQIAVIAIIAVGMTMVIITAGIDLSVGSLIALSAVVATRLIRDTAGGEQATVATMTLCCVAGIAVCAVVGAFSGLMVTRFRIPPFIVTLGMMLVASGLAYTLAEGQSIYQVPDRFIWLGRGADLLGIPNAVVLTLLLYAAAHVVMTRMTWGRYIYAVGGNREAARLSGVPVRRVVLAVYVVSGALAGLGGVVMASQLKSGSPTYGQMYELYVIAAVVVGGTSLSGGEGKVLGTLIGALIIAVIQNGMNLTGVESYTQKIVLGLVILGAVLLDMLKRQGWQLFRGGSM